ncbi:LysR family transcriptional regulator [Coralloluteibacterium stylophorae]|uniref:LysR family transcriptional regulator n=1 Tax=Coralloluteibacterium stylophorae TaxID=1776034 RepID=A0A8J8AWB9_9GAMM|nr:LysR family transcriptional regulator [Coralloluteibacterium stylophorae]MBS7457180.1 LysR family transcriptional regulator [Coralloluteibacterium stylophorae]
MHIEELRTFVEVADAGGVTAAALRLGVSKSIVSRRLGRLEAGLGIQLLARTTRGAALTAAGIIFRDHAARICAEVDAAKEIMQPAGELSGSFRIAAPLTFGPTHFAPVIADLARLNPRLQVRACYTDRFVNLVGEGFDCAIRIGHLSDSNLIARKVGYTPALYVATPEYISRHGAPETPEEFGTHDAVMQGTETWLALDGDRVITLKPHGRFKADNAVACVAAALAGLSVAGIPRELIIDHLQSGALVPVMTRYPPPSLGIYVVRPPGRHPERKVRVLTEMMIECCENLCRAISLRESQRAAR